MSPVKTPRVLRWPVLGLLGHPIRFPDTSRMCISNSAKSTLSLEQSRIRGWTLRGTLTLKYVIPDTRSGFKLATGGGLS